MTANTNLGGPVDITEALIPLESIRTNGGTQARVGLDDKAVREYAEAYRTGEVFPPVVVYNDGSHYWLVDGFHRHAAATQAELAEINAKVHRGGLRNAILAAAGANADHGVRRTNKDKRRAVGILLADEEWSGWSDRQIARTCRVSNTFVANLRKEQGVNVYSRPQANADNPALSGGTAPDARTHPALSASDPLEGACPTIRIGQDGRAYDVSALQARATEPPAQSDPPTPPNQLENTEDWGEDDWWIPPADEPCPAKAEGRTCDECPTDQPHHWEIFRPVGEPPMQVCKHCRTVGATVDDRPTPALPHHAPPEPYLADVELPTDERADVTQLPNDERAENDGYWTPDAHTLACCQWLKEQKVFSGQGTVLEPCVGGGAWIRAVAEVWPEAILWGADIDPNAPGLQLVDRAKKGDFLGMRVPGCDMIIGNPPYDSKNILAWLERSLQLAPVVAYLLRETITGTQTRRPWWEAHRPAWIAKTDKRPKWEGPGARDNSDFADSVLIVWVRGHVGPTLFDWIRVPDAEEAS